MSHAFFVDFEAFQHGGQDPMMKELCIMNASQPMDLLYYVFKPNLDWQELSSEERTTHFYGTRRIHHLHWVDGSTRYCKNCVMHHVKTKFPKWQNAMFYVLDKVEGPKVKFLKKEFPELNLVNYNGLTFKTLPPAIISMDCPYRPHGKHCAFQKCLQLYTHFNSFN